MYLHEYDFVVCGAGIAGITFALSLSNKKIKVLLVDEGGIKTPNPDELRKIYRIKGRKYEEIHNQIRKTFGGTSHLWGGNCIDFQEEDFDNSPIRGRCHWPFKYEEYLSLSSRAKKLLGLNSSTRREGDNILLTDYAYFDYWQFCKYPFKFDEQFFSKLSKKKNIDIFLHAKVIDIFSHDGITASEVKIFDKNNKKTIKIKAKKVIMAMGALENTRFLLNLKQYRVFPNIDSNNLIGKNFTEHPNLTIGYLSKPCDKIIEKFMEFNDGEVICKLGLIPSRKFLKSEKSLNFIISFWPKFDDDILLNRLKNYSVHKSKYGHNLWRLIHCVFKSKKRFFSIRKIVLAWLTRQPISFEQEQGLFEVRVMLESKLTPESRVLVTPLHSKNKEQHCDVFWKLDRQDNRTFQAAIKLLKMYVNEMQLGNFILKHTLNNKNLSEVESNTDGHFGHHMATTKMGDEFDGVLDLNMRLRGTSNIYVLGPSAFPNVSFANPTLMNMALSINLGDYFNEGYPNC